MYPHVRNRHFPSEFTTLSKKRRPMSPKRRVLPSKSWPRLPPRQKRQRYRGFDHLGRWGPRSGRPGHRPPGKMRYFRNDLGSFPGREAGSVWETHNTIEESTSRMAAGAVIYGISGDAVLRIRNTHGDLASRPAAGPVISGILGDAVFETGDTHGTGIRRPGRRKR